MTLLFGYTAIGLELIWRGALAWQPAVEQVITLPHVFVWPLFLLVVVVRGVRTQIRDPFVTISLLQGATCGSLTLGTAGGMLLTGPRVLPLTLP